MNMDQSKSCTSGDDSSHGQFDWSSPSSSRSTKRIKMDDELEMRECRFGFGSSSSEDDSCSSQESVMSHLLTEEQTKIMDLELEMTPERPVQSVPKSVELPSSSSVLDKQSKSSNNDDDGYKQQQLQQLLENIRHSYLCRKSCPNPMCLPLKKVMAHFQKCERKRLRSDCTLCTDFYKLLCYHVKHCQSDPCDMVGCRRMKRKFKLDLIRLEILNTTMQSVLASVNGNADIRVAVSSKRNL